FGGVPLVMATPGRRWMADQYVYMHLYVEHVASVREVAPGQRGGATSAATFCREAPSVSTSRCGTTVAGSVRIARSRSSYGARTSRTSVSPASVTTAYTPRPSS